MALSSNKLKEFRNNVCRGCLLVSPTEFSTVDERLQYSFTELSGIYLLKNGNLPHRLCSSCVKSIKQSVKFKNQCFTSNKILSELLQNSLNNFTGQFDLNDLRQKRNNFLTHSNTLTLSKTLTVECLDKNALDRIDQPKTFSNSIKAPSQIPPDLCSEVVSQTLNLVSHGGKTLPGYFIDSDDGLRHDGDVNKPCPENIYNEVSHKLYIFDSFFPESSLQNNSEVDQCWNNELSVKKEFNNSSYIEVSKDDDDIDDDDFDRDVISPNIKEESQDAIKRISTKTRRKAHKKYTEDPDDDIILSQLEPSSFKRKRNAVYRYETSQKSKTKDSGNLKVKKHKSSKLKKSGVKKTMKKDVPVINCHFDESSVNITKLSVEEQLTDLEEARKTKQYLEGPFKCVPCAKSFSYEITWQAHQVRHQENAGTYLCKICHQRYTTPRSLQCHSQIHEERLECKICLKVLSGRSHMAKHVAKHKGISQSIDCTICGSTSTSRSNHKRHMQTHHTSGPKQHKCPYCPRDFNHTANRNDHILRAHTGQKNFACDVCKATFVNKTALKSHANKHSQQRDFYCVECDKSYKTRLSLISHLNISSKHANPAYLKFQCKQCEKRYDTQRKLNLHVDSTHLRLLKWSCEKCSAIFRTVSGLRHHRARIHEGKVSLKNHMCDTCGRAYASKYKLKVHLRTHTSDRPYACD